MRLEVNSLQIRNHISGFENLVCISQIKLIKSYINTSVVPLSYHWSSDPAMIVGLATHWNH